MKKLLSVLAVIAVVFMFSQPASAQSKAAKKAGKKAGKIMCSCTALKELTAVMEILENSPDKLTPAMTSNIEANFVKAQGCMSDFQKLSESIDSADSAVFMANMDAVMDKKCPDIVKLLEDAAKD